MSDNNVKNRPVTPRAVTVSKTKSTTATAAAAKKHTPPATTKAAPKAAQNTASTAQKERAARQNIDVDKLSKKYQKAPANIVNAVPVKFNDQQKAELKKYIKDEKSLKQFLNYVKQPNLTPNDIIEGMKKTAGSSSSSWFDRACGVVVTLYEDGVSEAWDRAKSESVYHSKKTSREMNAIRKERSDLSSETVADIGDDCAKNKKLKQGTMHYVTKKDKNGRHVYKEKTIKENHAYMKKNPNKIHKFVGHSVELESITDKNGNMKYDGETMSHVAMQATDHENVSETIMLAAHKQDMTGEYLVNITDNLCNNESMQDAIKYALKAKKTDGSDLFSAENINRTSNYLADKDADFCNTYTKGLKELSQNGNLSGTEIIDQNEQNMNTSYRSAYSNFSENSYGSLDPSNNDNSSQFGYGNYSNQTTPTFNNNTTQTYASNPITSSYEKNVIIQGKQYNRATILEQLSKKYTATDAEKILQRIEENPQFISLMKKYGDNPALRKAIIENPNIISIIRNNISASIPISELAEMISLCQNKSKTKAVILLGKLTTPQTAIKYLKNPTHVDDIVNILENNSINKEQKLAAINRLTGK